MTYVVGMGGGPNAPNVGESTSALALSLPEWAINDADIADNPRSRSKVISEALLAFFSSQDTSQEVFRLDPSTYRRIVQVELPSDLLSTLDDWIAESGWRPRAHAIEQALLQYLDRSSRGLST